LPHADKDLDGPQAGYAGCYCPELVGSYTFGRETLPSQLRTIVMLEGKALAFMAPIVGEQAALMSTLFNIDRIKKICVRYKGFTESRA
jgi:hypothetical protein